MKKVLVLLIISFIAAIANAGLADFTLETDGTVLKVIGVADATVDGDYLTDGSGSVISIITTTPAVLHTDSGNGGINDYVAGDLAAVNLAVIGAPYGNVAQIFAMTSTDAADSVDGGLWFTIDIADLDTSGLSYGDTIGSIEVLDKEASSLGTIGITYVPEPMTVALLGLGGLFLRRRK